MFNEVKDTLTQEFETFFKKHYSLGKKINASSNSKSLLKAVFHSEKELKKMLKETYKQDPHLRRKAIALLYNELNQEYIKYPISATHQ